MATNHPPRKPPDQHDPPPFSEDELRPTNNNNNNTSNSDGPAVSNASLLLKQRRSTCSCSNIAIMQLFHEMKQKYPTVPDHVVSDLVTANCHNRPACIDSLEKAVLGTPAAAQAYPSQSIHSTSSLQRRINERKRNKLEAGSLSGCSSGSSSRESSVDKLSNKANGVGDVGGSNYHTTNRLYNSNNNNSSNHITSNAAAGELPRNSVGANTGSKTDNLSSTTTTTTNFDNNNNQIAPSRPNTLAFSGSRPTRVAPLPPISSTITASPELGETVNVQLNVTVSPVASRSPLGQRHTSTLQLQPEAPYSLELAQASSSFNTPGPLPPGANSRSSTSVNLTLRQPTDGPQSPIHIHASPLKYTAKGFNAQSGIQSKLEITFRDGYGSISAMRTHVPGFETDGTPIPNSTGTNNNNSGSQRHGTPLYHQEPLHHHHPHHHQQQPQHHQQIVQNHPLPSSAVGGLVGSSAAQFVSSNESEGLNRQLLYENYRTEVAITHQLDQKNRLSEEVERYRQQLDLIDREIRILQHPLSRADAQQLNREVQQLEEEVDRMQKEVDSTEIPAAVTDRLHNLNIEGSPSIAAGAVVNRPPRPPRPPPPRLPSALHQTPPPTQPPPYSAEGRYGGGRSMSAPAADHLGSGTGVTPGVGGPGQQWTCSLCTFQNHELMTRCEVCSLPKMSVVTSGQDIHIYLSPGQNKIVHSWIVS
ncbi:ankyrin repeat-containing protein kinase A-like isoform X2 [Uranotaenia lowii]|uniref:ankyrin repeat-containing protein kinase A-like isoform X2 n=1 Tax=Uranotaenia lowii TaxID=190385 RepID=UPI00247AD2CC|nr:ankyrin repeat-containing protein kinase A-like isoform X2 [Uranotaenia lowii]